MAASGELRRAKTIHFFRIILHSTLQDGRLRIPRKFASRYGEDLPNPVLLKPPDGTEWKVYWKKHKGEIWFEDGWKEFAEYFSLDFGYFMMFKYEEGASNFEVIILDMSTLEIDYPSHEKGTQDESIEIFEMPPCKKENRTKSPLKSLRPLKKLRTSTNAEEGGAFDLQNLCSNEKAKTNKQELEDKMERTSFSIESCGKSMAITRKKTLRSEEKVRALERVSSFTPKNPVFKIAVQPSYASGHTVNLPAGFSRKFLKKQGDVILQASDGRKWSAFYTCGLLGNKFKAKIQTGWKSFSEGNNLKVGDVCIFELMKSTVITFKVYISRAAKNLSCLPSQADRENLERGPHNNIISVCPMTMNDVEALSAPNKDIFAGNCSDNVVPSPQVHRRMKISVENAAFPKVGRPLSQKLPQALEEARSFSSKNPFFRVNISPSLLQLGKHSGKPAVPVGFLKNFMESRKKNATIQLGKRSWPAILRYYPHFSMGKLSVAWRSFAEESKLQLGDVCIFELIDRESAVLKVHIFRSHS